MNIMHGEPSSEPRAARAPVLDVAAIQALKERDNWRNFLHLGFVYLVIGATLWATYQSYVWVAEAGLGWWWNIPATLVGIVVIGASQHQFGGAIHEAAHFMLFKNRWLNEVVSDWFAAFPIYATTYQYRVEHLAHHQFVNDPVRDPDMAQLVESGHWLDFPMPQIDFLRAVARTLNPVRLFRYTMTRARYSAEGVSGHVYHVDGDGVSKWPTYVAIAFALVLPVVIARPSRWGMIEPTYLILGAAWLAAMIYCLLTPEKAFASSKLAPVISHRATMMSRLTCLGIIYGAVAGLQLAGYPAWNMYILLWVVPLITTFPLFMLLRQWVQHGNADRGRYTNSRVFHVNPLLRYCVFPWGQDYHLPHHIQASVPHFRLKQLHEHLLRDPEYRDKAAVLHGVLEGKEGVSITAALGPAHAPKVKERAHVDRASLEYAEVREGDKLERESARSERFP